VTLISTAGISRASQQAVATIVAVAALFIIAVAIPSNLLLINAGLAGVILLLTIVVLRMTVSIESTSNALLVRCHPFYSRTIALADLVDVSPAPSSSLTEGFGVRYLGRRTWGLLVGGPAVTVETRSRTWIISTRDPEATAEAIRALTPAS